MGGNPHHYSVRIVRRSRCIGRARRRLMRLPLAAPPEVADPIVVSGALGESLADVIRAAAGTRVGSAACGCCWRGSVQWPACPTRRERGPVLMGDDYAVALPKVPGGAGSGDLVVRRLMAALGMADAADVLWVPVADS